MAAVCYRIGSRGLEFLLVQSRSGRWIFPKGGVEPGLTQAQSAAMEAFEEAGVHGRIEEMPFARYCLGQRTRSKSGGKRGKEIRGKCPSIVRNQGSGEYRDSREHLGSGEAVTAHLCEVSRLEKPQEANRKPTWFSPQKAKRRLLEDRTAEFGEELARVVDRAVERIWRLEAGKNETKRGNQGAGESRKDELQQVQFEAFENARMPGGRIDAALLLTLLEYRGLRPMRPTGGERYGGLRKLPQLTVGAGQDAGALRRITAIDRADISRAAISTADIDSTTSTSRRLKPAMVKSGRT